MIVDDDIVKGLVISYPAMTREDILEQDWKHPCLNTISIMIVCGDNVHIKVFFLHIDTQEEFISYIAEKSLSHTIHYIVKGNERLKIILSEPKDHQTNIDADVIEHLGKLFFK